ncbi:SDR family NAD(P)-dependent oxidoreductase [Glycomyces tenuis]|uniref:SDR family NAD(P)-dependent oxidoreductase n=2 Tax=Glycomyces tenuis TaxID=58116 RepID=UPI0003F729C7|nr:SDR family NAD(P)-dependent oxidoreductase [Glycomyces tenuis]
MTTVVMTGGTSGIGAVAAARLREAGARLLIGGRTAGDGVLRLDLADARSVRAFAATAADRLDGAPIDALVLNAGLSFATDRNRTADGVETTFAVNHLSQYLLLRLLLPRLAEGARVVLTSSSTHDPEHAGVLPAPRHADAALLADPDRDPARDPKRAGGHAYTASKLCNVLTVEALNTRAEARERRITAIAYDPGPTPGTGLSRDFSPGVKLVWTLLGSPLGRLMPRFSSRAAAGGTMARLALGEIEPPAGRRYVALRRGRPQWTDPSELARDPKARDALWNDSAAMLDLEA